MFAELKSVKGKITEDQLAWLKALESVENVEVYVWRPADLDDALKILK